MSTRSRLRSRSRIDELGAIIDAAEAVKASADFDRLKQRIQRAARPGLFQIPLTLIPSLNPGADRDARNHPLHNIEDARGGGRHDGDRPFGLGAISPSGRIPHGKENPPGPTRTMAADAAKRKFVREIHRSLKANDERLSALAKRVLDAPRGGFRLSDRLVNMRIEEKSAEANYLNAKLDREVAEIEVQEYKEVGFAVQDQARGRIR